MNKVFFSTRNPEKSNIQRFNNDLLCLANEGKIQLVEIQEADTILMERYGGNEAANVRKDFPACRVVVLINDSEVSWEPRTRKIISQTEKRNEGVVEPRPLSTFLQNEERFALERGRY